MYDFLMYTNHELSQNEYTCVTTTQVKNKTTRNPEALLVSHCDFPSMKLVTILTSNTTAKLLLFI